MGESNGEDKGRRVVVEVMFSEVEVKNSEGWMLCGSRDSISILQPPQLSNQPQQVDGQPQSSSGEGGTSSMRYHKSEVIGL